MAEWKTRRAEVFAGSSRTLRRCSSSILTFLRLWPNKTFLSAQMPCLAEGEPAARPSASHPGTSTTAALTMPVSMASPIGSSNCARSCASLATSRAAVMKSTDTSSKAASPGWASKCTRASCPATAPMEHDVLAQGQNLGYISPSQFAKASKTQVGVNETSGRPPIGSQIDARRCLLDPGRFRSTQTSKVADKRRASRCISVRIR